MKAILKEFFHRISLQQMILKLNNISHHVLLLFRIKQFISICLIEETAQ